MKLSVIIPCYNAADTLAEQLQALAGERWSQPCEVVLADNGSTDQSVAIAHKYASSLPHLRIVDASGRRGQAYAKNVGARAGAPAVAFCDADDVIAPGWVAAIGEALLRHDFVASSFEAIKLNPDPKQNYVGNPQLGGLQLLWYPPYLPHAGGSGMGVKRALHEQVGGFDESFRAVEDTDYCIRIQLTGVRLHLVTGAIVHVRRRASLASAFRQARICSDDNTRLYSLHRPPGLRGIRPWWLCLQDWLDLLRSLSRIGDARERATWVYQLGWQFGLLQGSVKYRVAPISVRGAELSAVTPLLESNERLP